MNEADDRLDEAIARHRTGDGTNAELAAYRSSLAALEPLRSTPPRDPAASTAGRQAFLEQARALRQPVSEARAGRHTRWTFL